MDSTKKACLIMFISALCFSFMQIAVRYTSQTVPIFELVFSRNLVLLFSSIIVLKASHKPLVRNKKNILKLFSRGAFGLLGVLFYFIATKYLPSAEAAILQKSSPIFVAIFSYIFLKEKLSRMDIVAMILSFIGVIFVTKPSVTNFNTYSFLALLSAIFASMAYVIISVLKDEEDPHTIMLAFGLVTVIALMPFIIKDFYMPNLKEGMGLLAIAITGAGGQYFLTKSYTMANAGKVSIINYTNVIFSAIMGYYLWGDIIDLPAGIGIALIFGGALITYFGKNKGR